MENQWVGGLPPVGSVCSMDIGDGDTMDVEVVAHYKGSVVVCSTSDAPSCNGYGERIFTTMESVGPKCLRPIRNEEDLLVEQALKDISAEPDEYGADSVVYRMIKAGYRKTGGDA